MSFSREAKIAHINRSPEAVAVHDKAAWLDIFSQYAIVEDPVGSRPHVNGLFDRKSGSRGQAAFSRFYDTFIAPNQIVFDVQRDLVCGNHVVRDLTVNIDMSGVKVSVPMHLLYELTEEQGQLKIQRLAAHWELLPMVAQLLKKGLGAMPVLLGLSVRMMKHQGLAGAMGFMAGVGLLGQQARIMVGVLAQAIREQDAIALGSCFEPGATVHLPADSQGITPEEMLRQLPGQLKVSKVLLAGYAVTASIEYQPENGSVQQGVWIAEFNTRSKKIRKLSFYVE